MSVPIAGQSSPDADAMRRRLFLISEIALVTAGLVFSLRADVLPDLQKVFLDPIDPAHAAGLIGSIGGVAFLGFAISIFIGSPLCDYLGMGRLLGLSSLLFIVGTLTAIFARPLSHGLPVFWVLWVGMLTVGLGHGLVEAVINPLIATLYPDDKTAKLNLLHAWWPGGLIIGGLIGYGLDKAGIGWQIKLATILIPSVVYAVMLMGTKFPPTERIASGVSAREMWKEAARPLFIVWFLCMFLTASSELAPNQWVQLALTRTVGFQGILLLVYVSALMFVMRHFAGPVAHKFSPVGLLWWSSLLAAIGLLLLSIANSPVTGLLAATVWGTGVCYLWPTMLGVTSERFPKGGALLLGMMGTAGNLSVYLVLPTMGRIYDYYKVAALPARTSFDKLQAAANGGAPAAKATLNQSLAVAGQYSFRYVALLPAVLLVVFGIIWMWDKSHGGYKAVKLAPPEYE